MHETAEIPAVAPGDDPANGLSDDDVDDDTVEVEQARAASRRRGKRARIVTGVLALVAAVGMGFAGGVYYQKHNGTSTPTGAGAASSFASLARSFASRAGASGAARSTGSRAALGGLAGGGLFFATPTTSVRGTVTAVTGDTLYITETSNSALVKVQTTATSTVTVPTTASVATVRPGDTVSVSGAKQKDGSFMAATVTDSGASASGTGTTSSTGAAAG